LRINGTASISDSDPLLQEISAAQLIVRVTITDIRPDCPRNVHKMTLVEQSKFTPELDTDYVGKADWGDSYDDLVPDHMKSGKDGK